MEAKRILLTAVVAWMVPLAINIYVEITNLDKRFPDDDVLGERDYTFYHWQFWVFFGASMPVNVMLGSINNYFVQAAGVSFKRRRFLQKQLTQMLEYNLYQRPAWSASLPMINFIDPSSLLAWLNMRTCLIDGGARFYRRIDSYMAFYAAVVALNYVYLAAYGFNYVPDKFSISLAKLCCL